MKKIFLTSGLVLCMACPAFAEGSGFPASASGVQAEACVEPKLGVYEGPTTLKAVWDANKSRIDFQSDDFNMLTKNCQTNFHKLVRTNNPQNNHRGYVDPVPSPLWTRYDDAVYKTETGRDNFTTADKITSLTSTPVMTGYTFEGYYDVNDNGFRQGMTFSGTNIPSIEQSDYTTPNPTNTTIAPTEDNQLVHGTKWINADGTFVSGLQNYPGDRSITMLYPRWTPKEYTITYNCGSAGSTNVAPVNANGMTQSVRFDDCYSLLNVTAKCNVPISEDFGYTFGGWSCTPDLPNATKTLPADATAAANGYPANTAVESLYAAGAGGAWTLDGNATCTAIWVGKKIRITWNDNDGDDTTTATGGTPSCFYGTDVTLPTAPTRNGYTFGGWAVVPNTETAEPQNSGI